jgi:hypothetical protein
MLVALKAPTSFEGPSEPRSTFTAFPFRAVVVAAHYCLSGHFNMNCGNSPRQSFAFGSIVRFVTPGDYQRALSKAFERAKVPRASRIYPAIPL